MQIPEQTRWKNLLFAGDASGVLPRMVLGCSQFESMRGIVRACYIDPPFNTGEHFVHYKDKYSATVWEDMIRSSLTNIKDLLAENGSIWFHIGEDNQHRARLLLDECFGPLNFVATVIWQKRTSRDNRTAISNMHDYIHVYAKSGPKKWKTTRNGVEDPGTFSNPDNDPRGPWRSAPLTAQAGHGTASQHYSVISPSGELHDPPPGRCWTYTATRFSELQRDGRVYWPREGAGKPRMKIYESESRGLAPFSIWPASEVGDTASAKKRIRAEFPEEEAFDTPKPLELLERIIGISSEVDEIILDCFAGSGTTLVAAEKLGRRWIGVELNQSTIETFVIPRLFDIGVRKDAANPNFKYLKYSAGSGAVRDLRLKRASDGLTDSFPAAAD